MEAFSVVDEERWQKYVQEAKTDEFGAPIINYAARWAHLMERCRAEGETLKRVIVATSQRADTEDIGGTPRSCAVAMLMKYWRYGEALSGIEGMIVSHGLHYRDCLSPTYLHTLKQRVKMIEEVHRKAKGL